MSTKKGKAPVMAIFHAQDKKCTKSEASTSRGPSLQRHRSNKSSNYQVNISPLSITQQPKNHKMKNVDDPLFEKGEYSSRGKSKRKYRSPNDSDTDTSEASVFETDSECSVSESDYSSAKSSSSCSSSESENGKRVRRKKKQKQRLQRRYSSSSESSELDASDSDYYDERSSSKSQMQIL